MKILIVRFSAFGDIAMTVPVVDALARQYPDVEFTFMSRPFTEPLFSGMPSNVIFRGVNLDNYEGFFGLGRLSHELLSEGYDMIADLHDVLRTKVIRSWFGMSGRKVAKINKGRAEKNKLTQRENKVKYRLPSSFDRYADVFRRLGYPIDDIRFRSIYGDGKKGDIRLFDKIFGFPGDGKKWIGIAPFAAHRGKILPRHTMQEVISTLAARDDTRIFLFGGDKHEKEMLDAWALPHPNVMTVSGKLKLNGELSLMSHLDVMVSMDSANMHLASLVDTPVVSIWGATHPYAGFMGWRQHQDNAVQLDLPCRPCSIYGNKHCHREDYACLENITSEMVVEKIDNAI